MRTWIPNIHRTLVPLLTLFLLTSIGCGTTRALREAQSAFSDAATADMQLRTAPEETTAALLGVRNGGYRMTIGIIDGFNAIQRSQLSGNELWGNALMLKAMSHWRLAEYDAADKAANEAIGKYAKQLGPRDAAILSVLDGLIALDQAHAKLGVSTAGVFQCNYTDVNELVKMGLSTIENSRNGLSAGAPVQQYLLQSKLAGHKIRVDATECDDGGTLPSAQERTDRKNDYCALEATGVDRAVTRDWVSRLGIQNATCP
ncbi:MAG: hypothetical protein GY725_00820 [bacterium]|nr:hypothetical protein [bacterium]